MKSADLIDADASELELVHLPFRSFGRRQSFAGHEQTVRCFEDSTLIRAQLETPGDGRVLVADGAGATRIAVAGDILADLAINNDWEGVVLNGAIRDRAVIFEKVEWSGAGSVRSGRQNQQ